MIIDAYCRIRTIDQTIPDDVLDFMKNASIEKLNKVNEVIDLPSTCTCSAYKINSLTSKCLICNRIRINK